MSPFRRASVLVTIAILAVSAIGMSVAIDYFKIYLRKLPIYPADKRELMSLPVETTSWVRVGTDHLETEEIVETLGTRNYVTRTYVRKNADGTTPDGRDPSTAVLQFHAAYYTGMIDTVPHVADRCFVGGGMQIGDVLGDLPLPLDQSRWTKDEDAPAGIAGGVYRVRSSTGQYVRLPLEPEKLALRTFQFFNQGKPLYAGYFFVANGRHIASAEGVRLLAFDLQDSYAYYMKVQVTTDRVSSGKELTEQTASLLNELMGDIMLSVPDWIEVMKGEYPADNPKKKKEDTVKTGASLFPKATDFASSGSSAASTRG
jgi:hypothetical protein